MFRFEKLDVWQKATRFACRIDDETRRFPDTDRPGPVSQLQIALNQEFLQTENHRQLDRAADELARTLSGLCSAPGSRDRPDEPI